MEGLTLGRWRNWLVRLITVLGVLLPLGLTAQEAKIKLDVLGFTADHKQMLVRVDDVNTGLGLRIYDVDTGAPAKKAPLTPFQRAQEPTAIKEAKKKAKIKDDGLKAIRFAMDPNDPEAQLSFFGVVRGKEGERLVVAVTDGARMGKVLDVKVKIDEESKKRAEPSLKTIYWSTDKKLMVAVVTQLIDTPGYLSEVDEFHAQPFKPDEVQWVEQPPPEAKPEPGKEEKKDDKKKHWWWPFD